MTSPRSPVLLLGIDRLLGLQLARILWGHGIPVIGAAIDTRSHYCRTRAATRIVSTADLEGDPAGTLRALSEEHGARPVVIPCLDEFVWWLSDHRELVAEHADFLLPSAENLERLGDKSAFYRYAIEHGLPLPPTRFVGNREELAAAGRELGLPLILKPPRRSPEWMESSGGFKVLRFDDAEELLRTAAPLLEVAGELILQGWVDGGDECMHSVYVCLDRESRPILPRLVARKLRQWPPEIGVGCLAVEVREDALAESSLRMFQEMGYVGCGSLQYKRDPGSGRFYVIEANTRFALNFPLFEACGVEATLTHYCAAARLPLPEARTVTRPGSRWICWKRDLASAYAHWRRGEIGIRDWLRSLRGPKRSADLQWNDPMPQLTDLGRKLRGGLSRSARRTLSRAR